MADQKVLDEVYMDMAIVMTKLSKATRLKVGCIIVAADGGVIAEGTNGTYSGADNICESVQIKEKWLPTDFEYHDISNLGRVKRLSYTKSHQRKSKLGKSFEQPVSYKEKILFPRCNKKGYIDVKIDGVYKTVHRMIGKAFITNPDPEKYNQINHRDGDKKNNNIENLEWCTNIYNCVDRSQRMRQDDLPSNISFSPKGKFRYQVRYLKDGKRKTRRCVTLEEAKLTREKFIEPSDYVTYIYQITKEDLETKPEVLHAESNCLSKIMRSTNSSVGGTMYCTHSPCFECSKLIIQAGIVRVVFKDFYRDKDGLALLRQAGIEVEQYHV